MRYVSAKAQQAAETEAYRVYISDALYFSANGKSHIKRFYDYMHPAPEETRSAEEIIDNVRSKIERLVNK